MDRPQWLPTEIGTDRLPAPHRVVPVPLADGETLVLRQHGNPSGPRLVLSHGNGLAIDQYYPYWKHFLDRFEVIVYDHRNHGWNAVGDARQHTFANFVFDNERILDALDLEFEPKRPLGAFHSMASLTAIFQSLRVGPRWAGLVLFEPPLTPPLGHPLEGMFLDGQQAISTRAAKRQFAYGSYGEFEAVLRGASMFANLDEEAYALYAAATFRPADDGNGVVLRCPREFEADVYLSNLDSTVALAMGSFPTPLKVVAGDPTLPTAPPPSSVCATLFPGWNIEFEAVPRTGHFLQMEAPAACAEITVEFFERLGLC